jgi:hypothetical protein
MKKILLMMLVLSSCATSSTTNSGLTVMSESEYESVIDRFTDRKENYTGLYNTLQIGGTLENSRVMAAELDQNARLYQWDQSKFNTEHNAAEEKLSKETSVFISFFTPEKKEDDLNKSTSMWKIFLDANGRRFEGKAVKIKLQPVEVKSLFEYHNRFSTPYRVTFPIGIRLIEGYPSKLTVTGPVGSATLNFPAVDTVQK